MLESTEIYISKASARDTGGRRRNTTHRVLGNTGIKLCVSATREHIGIFRAHAQRNKRRQIGAQLSQRPWRTQQRGSRGRTARDWDRTRLGSLRGRRGDMIRLDSRRDASRGRPVGPRIRSGHCSGSSDRRHWRARQETRSARYIRWHAVHGRASPDHWMRH